MDDVVSMPCALACALACALDFAFLNNFIAVWRLRGKWQPPLLFSVPPSLVRPRQVTIRSSKVSWVIKRLTHAPIYLSLPKFYSCKGLPNGWQRSIFSTYPSTHIYLRTCGARRRNTVSTRSSVCLLSPTTRNRAWNEVHMAEVVLGARRWLWTSPLRVVSSAEKSEKRGQCDGRENVR